MKTLFAFGMFLALISLPPMILSFIISNTFWLFGAGLIVGAIGTFCCALSVTLKLASLLFKI